MIDYELRGNVAVIALNRPKVNALSPELVSALNKALKLAEKDPQVGAVLLCSKVGGVFSAGLDLKALEGLSREKLWEFLEDFGKLCRRVFCGQLPVVSVAQGHAVAGGCVLLRLSERAVCAKGSHYVGFTEVLLGLTLPGALTKMLTLRTGARGMAESILFAKKHLPEKALELGLVDELAEPEATFDVALAQAAELAAMPREAILEARKAMNFSVAELKKIENDGNKRFLNIWFTPQAQKAREDMLKSLGAKK